MYISRYPVDRFLSLWQCEQDSRASRAAFIPIERIAASIYIIRGQKILLDADLAELYGVETRAFNQAVRRNKDRFPEDFMFQLTEEEAKAF